MVFAILMYDGKKIGETWFSLGPIFLMILPFKGKRYIIDEIEIPEPDEGQYVRSKIILTLTDYSDDEVDPQ
jgi:hypothetical protein